nr:TRAP transporter substrate-binding protein [Stenotrophomonas pictorum]
MLTATDVHVADYPTVTAVKWIGQQLELHTGGRLRLNQYHSGQLGRESEAIDMARFGAIDITRVYSGALNNAFPLTRALCLPYVFDSVAHMRHALDSGIAEDVLRGFESRDLVGLAIYDCGARSFYNTKHPIVEPRQLHGLKLRVASSDIFLQLMRLFGANPTPMSLGDTFSGMETHMIDGAENNMRSFHSSRHFEAARYWSQSEHSYAPDILLMSRRSLEALSPADRGLLLELARQSVQQMRSAWDASEDKARQAVLAAGVETNAVDMAAFRAAAAPLLRQYLQQPEIAALHRRIRDFA